MHLCIKRFRERMMSQNNPQCERAAAASEGCALPARHGGITGWGEIGTLGLNELFSHCSLVG